MFGPLSRNVQYVTNITGLELAVANDYVVRTHTHHQPTFAQAIDTSSMLGRS